MNCEICGRDPKSAMEYEIQWYDGAWFNGIPNPFPGPIPIGYGDGWWVLRKLNAPALLSDALDDNRWMKTYKVFTCGYPVCVSRAWNHGTPEQEHRLASATRTT